jgi:AraC family transcriptional regulator
MEQPRITSISTIKLKGLSAEMSLIQNSTPELWSNFRRQQKQQFKTDPTYFFSVNVYPNDYFENFNPTNLFTKHALVSAEYAADSDSSWEKFELPGGLYAVFKHKGSDISIFQCIYTQWLPGSGYRLDNRPHFEKMPADYIPGHPDSEEEIYIPIRTV